MSRTTSYYELRDALNEPGCPICFLIARTAERYLSRLLWENVNDLTMRDQIRKARGFCRDHTWDLARHRAALGTAIITRDVLQSVLKELEASTHQGSQTLSRHPAQVSPSGWRAAAATAALVDWLSPQAECPACIHVGDMEEIFLTTFVAHLLGTEGLLTAFESSDGLCLPHFRQALRRVGGQDVLAALVRAQCGIWRRLSGQLSEFIRKNDYRFRDEPWGDERDAWRRAIAALAGSRPN